MAKRLMLRSWRVVGAEPSGLFVWFDPARESVELYELEPPEIPGVDAYSEEGDQDRSDPSNLLFPQGELPF